MRLLLALPLLLVACAVEGDPLVQDTSDTSDGSCSYPSGAVEPMALGEVLYPYSWPTAIRADGRTIELDLRRVHCADPEDVDWSPHDLLLFVSIPAW